MAAQGRLSPLDVVTAPVRWASDAIAGFLWHTGALTVLTGQTFLSAFRGRFEVGAVVYQMEMLGVKSFGIASVTAVFVGMVMAIQFAFSLERYGAADAVGRIVGLSIARELAPALTALVVGGRIGAGMAAELGSMNVTEQVDAVRALGADPVRKLVLPRVLACILVMPLLTCFANIFGFLSAMIVCNLQFGTPLPFFVSTAIDSVKMQDFLSGIGKTPFFGFVIAILGCHFGLLTTGGTEGVGRSTTAAVVVVSVCVLIADTVLTQLFLSL
ncbi:MAG: ABC transporter permease [Deltaproteobacteria bacterium]|nr:ABC transporter permease [Deltaproteobacteria bacterium]